MRPNCLVAFALGVHWFGTGCASIGLASLLESQIGVKGMTNLYSLASLGGIGAFVIALILGTKMKESLRLVLLVSESFLAIVTASIFLMLPYGNSVTLGFLFFLSGLLQGTMISSLLSISMSYPCFLGIRCIASIGWCVGGLVVSCIGDGFQLVIVKGVKET